MFAPLENGRKLSRRLQVGNNTARDFAAASCETSGQQKSNVMHISSTAYEQDRSGAPQASIGKPGPNMARHEGTPRASRSESESKTDMLGSCDVVRGPRCPPL